MGKHEPVNIRYIGGPTAIIEFCGMRFLTDPTFDGRDTEYTSGPVKLKKLDDPLITVNGLGPIDYVLLSHDQHSDNLDRTGREMLMLAGQVLTTQAGAERLGENAVGFVPWQTISVPTPGGASLLITSTPARHGPYGCEARSGPVTGFALRRQGATQADSLGTKVWRRSHAGST